MNYRILVPVSLTILVSLGIGFILSDFIDLWKGAAAGLILQFIIRYVIDTLKTNPQPSYAEEAIEELINAQTSPITCPCGNYTFFAPIFFNKENIFQCEKCSSKFRAEVNIETILLTEPVNLQNAFDHLKKKEL